MTVHIIRVSKTRRRFRPGKSTTTDKAFVHAIIDGFNVTCRAGRGWGCSCDDTECVHPDALAAVLHPEVLAELEGDDQ